MIEYSLLEKLKDHHMGTYYHSLRVSQLCLHMATILQLDHESIVNVTKAGMLHDIGKLFVPNSLLSKKGPLSPHESEVVKEHVNKGVCLLQNNRFNEEITTAVRDHHERENGSGYPKGHTTIGTLGRIVAICDVFDAVTVDRDYRKGIPAHQALKLLINDELGALYRPFVFTLKTAIEQSKSKLQRIDMDFNFV